MGKIDKAAIFAAGAVGAGFALRAALRRKQAADLSGRVVLITGGSRGLGLALAREFAREGCRLAICSRHSDELEAASRDPRLIGNVFTVECDVTDRNEVERMIERVSSQFGTIDILVNNAGQIRVGPLESMTVRDFEEAMAVMYWGVVYPTMALLPNLLQRRSGAIVNITSIGGKVAIPHLLAYDAAKFAAVGFSEGLRAELTGTGVKVTTIVPGLMRTGSYVNAWFKGDVEREAAWFGLAATVPGITTSATRAARQIVRATKRGDAEKILSLPAKLLAFGHALAPGLSTDILGWVNRFLLPSGSNPNPVQGHDTEVLHARPMVALTTLGRRAGRSLHQERPPRPVEARQ